MVSSKNKVKVAIEPNAKAISAEYAWESVSHKFGVFYCM